MKSPRIKVHLRLGSDYEGTGLSCANKEFVAIKMMGNEIASGTLVTREAGGDSVQKPKEEAQNGEKCVIKCRKCDLCSKQSKLKTNAQE